MPTPRYFIRRVYPNGAVAHWGPFNTKELAQEWMERNFPGTAYQICDLLEPGTEPQTKKEKRR